MRRSGVARDQERSRAAAPQAPAEKRDLTKKTAIRSAGNSRRLSCDVLQFDRRRRDRIRSERPSNPNHAATALAFPSTSAVRSGGGVAGSSGGAIVATKIRLLYGSGRSRKPGRLSRAAQPARYCDDDLSGSFFQLAETGLNQLGQRFHGGLGVFPTASRRRSVPCRAPRVNRSRECSSR